MRRERIFMFLGIWVAVLPYLGFPYSWKSVLFTVSGAILIYYSYQMHKENKVKNIQAKQTFYEVDTEGVSNNFNQDNNNQNNNFDAGKNF